MFIDYYNMKIIQSSIGEAICRESDPLYCQSEEFIKNNLELASTIITAAKAHSMPCIYVTPLFRIWASQVSFN